MKTSNQSTILQKPFSVLKVGVYILLTIIFLTAASTVTYILNQYLSDNFSQFIGGLLFSLFALSLLAYIYFKKHKNIVKEIGIGKIKNKKSFIISIILPIILIIVSYIATSMMGLINGIKLDVNSVVLKSFVINLIIAILFEALPEELLVRGLILNELRKKFAFVPSLFIQTFIFTTTGAIVYMLNDLVTVGTLGSISIGTLIQFFVFGIALQLYREYAGSLYANIFFHLTCLEMSRFFFTQQNTSITKYFETVPNIMMLIGLFLCLYIGSIIILSLLIFRNRTSERR